MVDFSVAFQGKHGICRIVSLIAGLLVFITLVARQFYTLNYFSDPNVGDGGFTQLDWFGLFGFVAMLLYLLQVAWAGILLRIGKRPGVDKTALKQVDGGLNGSAGGVLLLLCVWWILILLNAFSNSYDTYMLTCVHKDNRGCIMRKLFGFAVALWVFALTQGISSVILGFFLYRNLQNKDGNEDQEPQSDDPKANEHPSATATEAESFRTAPV